MINRADLNMNRYRSSAWIAACAALIIASFFTKGITLIVACALIVCFIIYKKGDPDERRAIAVIFLLAFLSRAVIACGYQWYVDNIRNGLPLTTDESYYLTLGWYQGLMFKLKDMTRLTAENYACMNPVTKDLFTTFVNAHGNTGTYFVKKEIFSYVLGFFYFVYGYSPLLARFLNIFISVLSGLTVYLIAKTVFNKNVARISFIFFILLPAQIFFSITIMNGALISFFIIFMLFIFYRFKRPKDFVISFLLLLLSGYIFFHLKKLIFYLLIVVLAILFLIRILDFKRYKIRSLILTAAILAIIFNGRVLQDLNNFLRANCYILLQKHIGIARSLGETSYSLLPGKFYTVEDLITRNRKSDEILNSTRGLTNDQIKTTDDGFFDGLNAVKHNLFFISVKKFIPTAFIEGFFYTLFKPFPWQAKKMTQILASIHMIFWYFLFPFMCMGLWHSLRNLTKDKAALAIFFFSFISALALSEGNIGGLFRHREIISFAYIIFAAKGYERFGDRKYKCAKP